LVIDEITDMGLISIHAPVKGATATDVFTTGHIRISIHAPVKGATSRGSVLRYLLGFQSTHP